MIYIDEWAHSRWSVFGMFSAEAIMAIIGVILFISIFISVNRMKLIPEIAD
jgi:MFS transporter, PAT family, beta-lactamase induction signal transducer AmpG